MTFADLSGILIHRMRFTIPWSGRWHADLSLVDATDIAGPQILSLVGTTWSCSYVRAIDFAGDRGVRIVAGTGGWSTTIQDKQYGAGVIATATVCSDAALACGEATPVIDLSVPQTVGNAFLRQRGPAVLVLQEALGDAWWTDTTGTVQTKPRTGTVSSPFVATKVDGASGTYEIATEAPNDWMPGVTFSGPTVSGTVSRVMHVINRTRLRTEVLVVWNRLKTAWKDILEALLPSLATYVRWEFRVESASPGPPVLITASAVAAACPWQRLANITLWPGPSGAYAVPIPGSLVLVEFHEGDSGKPSIAGLDPNNPPAQITLGAGTDPVAMSIPADAAVTAIVTAFNTHTHSVPAGPGTSGPAVPLIAPVPGSTASTFPVFSR